VIDKAWDNRTLHSKNLGATHWSHGMILPGNAVRYGFASNVPPAARDAVEASFNDWRARAVLQFGKKAQAWDILAMDFERVNAGPKEITFDYVPAPVGELAHFNAETRILSVWANPMIALSTSGGMKKIRLGNAGPTGTAIDVPTHWSYDGTPKPTATDFDYSIDGGKTWHEAPPSGFGNLKWGDPAANHVIAPNDKINIFETDFRTIIDHEIGHAIGLEHTGDGSPSIMQDDIGDRASFGSTMVIDNDSALAIAINYTYSVPKASTMSFRKIADTTTPVPNRPSQNFLFFDHPPAISGGTVAFQARNSRQGIYRGSGGALTKIVADGDPVPGTATVFGSGFSHAAISGSKVAFQSAYPGGNGVFVGSGGPLTVIAKNGDAAPSGGTFDVFANSVSISGDVVAFHARTSTGDTGIFAGSGPGPTTKIVMEGEPAPLGTFTTFFAPAISGNQVAFHGRYRDDIGSGGDGIFRGSGGDLTPIAKSGDNVPGEPSWTIFWSFKDPAISGNTVAFIGDYNDGSGVFVGSGGALTAIALTGKPTPWGTFTGFDGPAVSGSTVAFRGRYTGGTGGTAIFMFSDGILAPVIKTGDPLFGSTVNGLASNTSFGVFGLDAGGSFNLAFQYSLADGRDGVAMAMVTVPVDFNLDWVVDAADFVWWRRNGGTQDQLNTWRANFGRTFASPILPGDYNDNGTVEAADYVVWRKNNGTTNTLPNDPHGGTIGSNQFNTWRANFGRTLGGSGSSFSSLESSASVPEPATLALIVVAGLFFFGWQRRHD
jgi:hypothetical protein